MKLVPPGGFAGFNQMAAASKNQWVGKKKAANGGRASRRRKRVAGTSASRRKASRAAGYPATKRRRNSTQRVKRRGLHGAARSAPKKGSPAAKAWGRKMAALRRKK